MPAVPQAPEPPERPRDDEAPVLPQRGSDEDDMGWGDREERVDRDEWYRRERPPHHE